MEYYLVTNTDRNLLLMIRSAFTEGKKNNQLSEILRNFDSMLPSDPLQPCFGIAIKHGILKFIYTIHKEYKLTRNLSTVYHTENIYENSSQGLQQLSTQRKRFQQWLVSALNDGYKILGLNCGDGVFTPHQKYMDVQDKFKPML